MALARSPCAKRAVWAAFHDPLRWRDAVTRILAFVATEAGIGLLALNHLVPADDPLVTEQHWIEALRSQYEIPLVVGRDGMVLPLPRVTA